MAFHDKCYALMRGGRIYTLKPYTFLDQNYRLVKHPHYRWRGFCDGQSFGIFRSKKEFEDAVSLEPGDPPLTESAIVSHQEEAHATWQGNQLLHQLIAACKKQRRSNGQHLQANQD